jgi:hypothetical protein
LNGGFKAPFFLALGELELSDLLFSTDGTAEARQGKQLPGIVPQMSNNPSSLPAFSSTEVISSRNTGCFTSFESPSDLDREST